LLKNFESLSKIEKIYFFKIFKPVSHTPVRPIHYSIIIFERFYSGETVPFYILSFSSSELEDELVWAAAWLYKASGEQAYLTKAEQIYQGFPSLFQTRVKNKISQVDYWFL
jgi:hypothetical protein